MPKVPLDIGIHLATLNLFREQDGTYEITVAGSGTGMATEFLNCDETLYPKPIDCIEHLILIAATRMAKRRAIKFDTDGGINWKAELEAASSRNIRLLTALNKIANLGCCGKNGNFQSALDIAIKAITEAPEPAAHRTATQSGEKG